MEFYLEVTCPGTKETIIDHVLRDCKVAEFTWNHLIMVEDKASFFSSNF